MTLIARTLAALCATCVLGAAVAWAAPAAPKRVAPKPAPRVADGAADTLAWVGPDAITLRDLRQRLELMPFAGRSGGRDADTVKALALEALIAEKLLAREADARQLGEQGASAPLPRMRAALESALLRDALYRREIAGRAQAAPAQIDSLLRTWPARGSAARRRQAAADTLRIANEEALAREFAARVLGPQQARVEQEPFLRLSDTLRAVIASADSAHRVPGGWRIAGDDLDAAMARLQPWLGVTLVRLGADSLSLGAGVESMRFQRFTVESLGRRAFAIELNHGMRAVVEGELLAREARRRGLAADPELQRELRLWTDAWKAQLARSALAGDVRTSDDEALRWFARTNPERALASCELSVQEVLCAGEPEAREVLAALRAGAPFDSVARDRTRRAAWEAAGGRSGWFAAGEQRELSRRALAAPLDSLAGPVRLAEGVSVFRVLGRRLALAGGGTALTMDHLRDAQMRDDRAARADAALADLVARAHVRRDLARLRAAQVSNVNMLTKRSLGFGGEMLAAPMLVPARIRELRPALP